MKNLFRTGAGKLTLLTIGGLCIPSMAQAHPGVGAVSGFHHGLVHPMLGLDHIAAMVAVGLWAAQRGGRATWTIPMSFMVAMVNGGCLGACGVAVPFVEPGIMASVLVLGVLVAASVRLPLVASCLLTGLFAIFHGHAHGAEMPLAASGIQYAAGFLLSTGLLHAVGISLALWRKRSSSCIALTDARASSHS